MDHQEKHHQHKEQEHEQEKKEHKAYEQRHEKQNWLPFHPLWLVVVGVVLTGAAVLVWTFGFRPFG